jgi:monothiol glutaredoxin
MSEEEVAERIRGLISENRAVLFMKGDSGMPQCGFSAATVQVLQLLRVPFLAVNVLLDVEIREGVKRFARWPTIPQLYIDGEFVGGCDIVREMFDDGSLEEMMKAKGLQVLD